MSQRDLARLSDLSPGRIGNLEASHRRASDDEIEELARALKVSPAWLRAGTDWMAREDREWLLENTRAVRRWFPRRRPVAPGNGLFSHYFEKAEERYPDLVRELKARMERRKDADEMARFLLHLPCDSDLEAIVIAALVAGRARPFVLGLGEVAFSSATLRRDRLARSVLERRHRGLALEWSPGVRMVFVPQIPVRGRKKKKPYRVDFLVALLLDGDASWLFLEIDGAAHDGRFDEERTKDIGMTVLRLGSAQVLRADLAAKLPYFLEPLLDPRGRSHLQRLLRQAS